MHGGALQHAHSAESTCCFPSNSLMGCCLRCSEPEAGPL